LLLARAGEYSSKEEEEEEEEEEKEKKRKKLQRSILNPVIAELINVLRGSSSPTSRRLRPSKTANERCIRNGR